MSGKKQHSATGNPGRPLQIDEPFVLVYQAPDGSEVREETTYGKALVKLTRQGVSPGGACDAIGLNVATYHDWNRRGKDALFRKSEGEKLDAKAERLAKFAREIQGARGNLERRLEMRLAELLPSMEAREVTDVLARLSRHRWSKQDTIRLHHSGAVQIVEKYGETIAVLIDRILAGLDLTPEQKERAPRVVREALAGVVAQAEEVQG